MLKLKYDKLLSNSAFNFNFRRHFEWKHLLALSAVSLSCTNLVGRCRLTVSKPVLKAPKVPALETIIS